MKFHLRGCVRVALPMIASLWCALSQAGVQVGDVPPDYLGNNFRGDPVHISGFKGKVVVVTFWATWCGPCRAEMGILENLEKAAGHERIEVIAVNDNESQSVWRTMKSKLSGLSITITHDSSQKVTEVYEIKAIPHMFIIDKTGHVAYMHMGYDESSLDGFVDEINTLLAEPATPLLPALPSTT